jgi:hypothetical protein
LLSTRFQRGPVSQFPRAHRPVRGSSLAFFLVKITHRQFGSADKVRLSDFQISLPRARILA